ncbi:MAG: M20/M25/M40 family metallo-hydrolase [Terriglobales bacterium]
MDQNTQRRLFDFLRALVDIDSTTGREGDVARFVSAWLQQLPGVEVELQAIPDPDSPFERCNLIARCGHPRVVLSTHLDTVPPFFPSREDDDFIHGRGACDAKGIIAAQVFAAAELLAAGVSDFGLLFVAGEERNSAGAFAANLTPPQPPPRFLINGEPTQSKIITAGKGVLRMNLKAQGRAAHSAYPELGESAINKLLDALARLRALALPVDPQLGPTHVNIGTIRGGCAPNVIADQAEAEIMFRLVGDAEPVKNQAMAVVQGLAQLETVLEMPAIRLHSLPDFPTGTVAFGTDIPNLTAWGQPLLFGPGSIHVAHTPAEHIAKSELAAAVGVYADLVGRLQAEKS